MASASPLMKLEAAIYKADNVLYDDFIQYMTEVYAKKAIPILERHGVVRYVQTAQPPEYRETYRQGLKDMGRPAWTVPRYDMVVAYWLRDPLDMTKVTSDPEWDALEKEGAKWANMGKGHLMIGHEFVQFEGKGTTGPAA